MIHPSAIIDHGAAIGVGTRIWHFTHVCAGAQIGADCSLGQNVFVADHVVLGNGVKVQNNVSLYEGVICADEVFIGPSVVFTNVTNPRSAINRRGEYKKTMVGRGVTIGANATILCGIALGAYCFIGAGAVVTKSVPAFALLVGNPAKQMGWMSRVGQRLDFADGQAICPQNGDIYQLLDGNCTLITEQNA
jgi:UDP-2-acetamido-3-amino-2,3-dideoxy-glucuronate N-acetyltransferase